MVDGIAAEAADDIAENEETHGVSIRYQVLSIKFAFALNGNNAPLVVAKNEMSFYFKTGSQFVATTTKFAGDAADINTFVWFRA